MSGGRDHPALQHNAEGGALIGVRTSFFTYGFRRNPSLHPAGPERRLLAATRAGSAEQPPWTCGKRIRKFTSSSGRRRAPTCGISAAQGTRPSKSKRSSTPIRYTRDDYQLSRRGRVAYGPATQRQGRTLLEIYQHRLQPRWGDQHYPPVSGPASSGRGRTARLAYDSRDVTAAATRGAHVAVEGTVYPAAWMCNRRMAACPAKLPPISRLQSRFGPPSRFGPAGRR
mgnify:CR=1 FL=1